jgi:hypothetical protein
MTSCGRLSRRWSHDNLTLGGVLVLERGLFPPPRLNLDKDIDE